eukprot:91837-Pyramimonas_sp.AAC.1
MQAALATCPCRIRRRHRVFNGRVFDSLLFRLRIRKNVGFKSPLGRRASGGPRPAKRRPIFSRRTNQMEEAR